MSPDFGLEKAAMTSLRLLTKVLENVNTRLRNMVRSDGKVGRRSQRLNFKARRKLGLYVDLVFDTRCGAASPLFGTCEYIDINAEIWFLLVRQVDNETGSFDHQFG